MAQPVNTSLPLTAYNFRVTVATTTMSFVEVSGIAATYEHVVYRHGLSFIEGENITTFKFDAFSTITMKRGSIPASQPLFLFDWLKQRDLRPIDVNLCDAMGKPVLAWKIAKAVPVKLTAPAFDPKSNEVAIDVLEVQARGVSLVHVAK